MSFEDQISIILNGCDKDQLNKYLNDEESSDLLVKSLDSYQALLAEKEKLQLENRKLAESNLCKEPVLEKIKQDLAESMKEFENAKQEYISLKETYDAQSTGSGDMSLNSILNTLQINAVKAEEESEKSAEDFFIEYTGGFHSEEELNNFQKQFLEARTQAHIKKIKAEKMTELLPN